MYAYSVFVGQFLLDCAHESGVLGEAASDVDILSPQNQPTIVIQKREADLGQYYHDLVASLCGTCQQGRYHLHDLADDGFKRVVDIGTKGNKQYYCQLSTPTQKHVTVRLIDG